jgi:hypothetical protein
VSKKDYYEVLGVKRDSSAKEIKTAYYDLAKKFHPDRNPNDKTVHKKFQEVSEAYEVFNLIIMGLKNCSFRVLILDLGDVTLRFTKASKVFSAIIEELTCLRIHTILEDFGLSKCCFN